MTPTCTRRLFLRAGGLWTLLLTLGDVSAAPQEPGAEQAPQTPRLFSLEQTVWRVGASGVLRSAALTGTVKLAVTNYDGKTVWSGGAKASEAGSRVLVPVRELGHYALTAQGGGKTERIEFAVVPPLRAESSAEKSRRQMLGVCTHFGQRDTPLEAYDLLQKLGVDAVRDEMGWGAMEKEKGVFRFALRHETYTRRLRERGIGLLFVASYGNPLYNKGAYPVGEEAAKGYGRYCAEVLKRYGKGIVAVEILNEPNVLDPATEYLPILKSAHEQIRAAGLAHEIISVGGAGVGGGMNPSFAAKLMEAGGAAHCDSFASHPYMSPNTPDAGYPTTEGSRTANLDMALSRASLLVEKHSALKGFWVTEVGWPSLEPEAAKVTPAPLPNGQPLNTAAMVSPQKQAAFTARTLLGASRYPHLRGVFLYDFQDDGPNPHAREHRFGLVRQDFSPKPAYQAYAIAAHFLGDKTFVRRIHGDDSRLSANLYRDNGGKLWAAVWTQEITNAEVAAIGEARKTDPKTPLPARHSERENPRRFVLPPRTSITEAYDWQGRPLNKKKAERGEVAATSLPLYLCLGSASDAVTIEEI